MAELLDRRRLAGDAGRAAWPDVTVDDAALGAHLERLLPGFGRGRARLRRSRDD
jgi:hypothetical protein